VNSSIVNRGMSFFPCTYLISVLFVPHWDLVTEFVVQSHKRSRALLRDTAAAIRVRDTLRVSGRHFLLVSEILSLVILPALQISSSWVYFYTILHPLPPCGQYDSSEPVSLDSDSHPYL